MDRGSLISVSRLLIVLYLTLLGSSGALFGAIFFQHFSLFLVEVIVHTSQLLPQPHKELSPPMSTTLVWIGAWEVHDNPLSPELEENDNWTREFWWGNNKHTT